MSERQGEGSARWPIRHRAFVQGNDEYIYNRDVFSYESGGERTVGYNANVQFTVDWPASVVWPVFKDFNIWQNCFGHYYPGAFGDMEGQLGYLVNKPEKDPQFFYIVEHVIPEHLIVLSQPTHEVDGIKHIGTHAFILTDHAGKTAVTGVMQHAKRAANLDVKRTVAEYEAFIGEDKIHKWATVLGPSLKKCVADAQR